MKLFRRAIPIAAWFAFMAAGFGQCTTPTCSAVIPTTALTGTVASSNLGNTSMRIEARLHGQNWSANGNVIPIFNVAGFAVFFLGGNGLHNLLFFGGPDPSGIGYGNCDITIGSPSDITIGMNRDVVNSVLRVYVLNTQTGVQLGHPCDFALSSIASGPSIQAQGISIGASNATGDVGFLRWYSGVVPDGTRIPAAGSVADLGDWEFEHTATDSSGHAQNLSGTTTYANTPTYLPTCNAGVSKTVNLGSAVTLDGSGSYPLDGGTSLAYSWTYSAGADGIDQGATISNATTANPLAGHLVAFGSANFNLTVTDGSAQSSSCTVHDGVVPFDSNGVVNMAAEGRTSAQISIAGPLIAFGHNPWPWADDRDLTELALQSCNLGLSGFTNCATPGAYTPYWRNFAAGTVSFTGGSATVVGSGTSFQALFCGGGTLPVNDPKLVWQYLGTDGITHYTQEFVSGCADDTHLTLAAVYPTTPRAPFPACSSVCSGLSYRGVDGNTQEQNTWEFNSAPGNYYDNLEASLTGYWRSGFDTYYSFAQTMWTDWLEIPTNDYFFNCNIFGNNFGAFLCQPGPARGQAFTGIILHEQDGHPELLPGLRNLWIFANFELGLLPAQGSVFDVRENAYELSALAQCALVDTDPTQNAFCVTALRNSLTNVWTPFRRTDLGNGWGNYYSTSTPGSTSIASLGGAGSVQVTTGSTTVIGSGTSWTSGLNGSFWVFNAPAGIQPATNAGGDSTAYQATIVADNILTLDRPYEGQGCSGGCSGRGFQFGNGLVAWGIQPFMEGHLGLAFCYAGLAPNLDAASKATYLQYCDGTVQWLITYGINPGLGGLYYGSLFPGCSPPVNSAAVPNCYPLGSSPSQTRTLATEVIHTFALDYMNFGSPSVKAAGDLIMSQMFAKPGTGGLNPDGFYLSDFDDGGNFLSGPAPLGSPPKWFGELCGYTGGCSVWAAARFLPPATHQTSLLGNSVVQGKAAIQ